MPLSLPDGSECFVDANILVYHFTSHDSIGASCTEFVKRVAAGEIRASTTALSLADTLHKIMLAEIRARHQLDRTGLVAWVQRHRDRLSELTETLAACEQLERLPLRILPVDVSVLRQAMAVSGTFGLLTGDACAVALMQRYGISHLVSNDDDFDRVAGLTVWKPR